ncbi:MAG: hypothetical protein AAF481_16385 [Acidobacteriota bacterium]
MARAQNLLAGNRPSLRRSLGLVLLLALGLAAIDAYAQPIDCELSTKSPVEAAESVDLLHALPHSDQAAPHSAFHGQLLFGDETQFLYHLPLFMDQPSGHPHNFQVILAGALDGETLAVYGEDRAANPESLYSATPANFDQTSLVLEYPGHTPLRQLPVGVFRGHFERPPNDQIVEGGTFHVSRVVHFREFQAGGGKAESLSYVLFGGADELFAAHWLSAPPDFDQILALTDESEAALGEELVAAGLYLTVTGRDNDETARLKAGDTLACRLETDGETRTVNLRVARDLYCEAGEVAQVGFGPGRACSSGLGG